jgi:putative acetyltransferase
MEAIMEEAKRRGYERVSSETGAEDYFEPACRFYEALGFGVCEPFAHYVEDPGSIFMTKEI